MLSGEELERTVETTRAVRTFPLNSRRLTGQVVQRIAVALGLPKGPLADVRQMVEGSLSEERETQNVQVDMVDSESGTVIRL